MANKLLQVQLENMWRPLINIINNKYLDTPECSQSVSRAGRAARAARQAGRHRGQGTQIFSQTRLRFAVGGGCLCALDPSLPGRYPLPVPIDSTLHYAPKETTTLSSLSLSLSLPLPFYNPIPTSSSPSPSPRFVFCQMFGLMMALMDGSHVSGSHLVIYLKTFQINRPQLSQSLREP